ncbi:MAG: YabP/YqfC family sporulation protein [Clostridia bacterium]|nr:YabP/YqfC family sporulation protein [Clostridia bacterium]
MGKINKTSGVAGMLLSGAHIELFSNREAIIDGIRGVIEYNDCYVKLNVGKGTLDIFGNTLEISSLDADGLVISGKIEKIEFCL